MPTQEVALTIVRIGLATQFAATILLVFLFLLLRRQARRRDYFVYWGWGWGLLALGLTALFVQFFFFSGPFSNSLGDGRADRLLNGLYQFLKLGFLASMLAGTLVYARGIRGHWLFRAGLGMGLVLAVACFLADGTLAQSIVWQIPFTAGAFLACAVALLRLPPSRRSLGSRVTGLFFGLFGIVWLGYALVFLPSLAEHLPLLGPWLNQVALYIAHIDVLLQMLVAFGMIVILLEDAKRETEAAHAELAVAHQELKAEALRDSLTRALNRRAFNEGAGLDAARSGVGTVIVFDLDDLKNVNDVHGHRAGDAMLRYFVDVLRPELRPTDKLFRFGGDEFLLVMPQAHRGEVTERFRSLLAGVPPLSWDDDDVSIPLRVSMGAASFRGGEDMDEAVVKADRAMYDEKRQHKLFDG